jgi:hypothetical protein
MPMRGCTVGCGTLPVEAPTANAISASTMMAPAQKA